MAALALVLSAFTGQTVFDKTGLKGSYSFSVDWTPFIQPLQPPPGGDEPVPAFPPDLSRFAPAIAMALEDELGLKLDSAKGPVEVLVVDHVERPSAN
jgi:uncharacterized protein (TIGR03435 family)